MSILCRAGAPADRVAGNLRNDFEAFVIPAFPAIAAAREGLLRRGALAGMMSGSGSSVFGIFGSLAQARKAWASVRPLWPRSYIAHSAGSQHDDRR